jgi:hypothetical protein
MWKDRQPAGQNLNMGLPEEKAATQPQHCHQLILCLFKKNQVPKTFQAQTTSDVSTGAVTIAAICNFPVLVCMTFFAFHLLLSLDMKCLLTRDTSCNCVCKIGK